jgi:hypothetical protein
MDNNDGSLFHHHEGWVLDMRMRWRRRWISSNWSAREGQGCMKSIQNVGLKNVQTVSGGSEGDLWELVMGEQIHIGGFQAHVDTTWARIQLACALRCD